MLGTRRLKVFCLCRPEIVQWFALMRRSSGWRRVVKPWATVAEWGEMERKERRVG